MEKIIDLHTHSNASDGQYSPAELISRAKETGLSAIALTDHDTINGLEEAQEAARDNKIEFIRGCELSVKTPFGNLHILGLWVPEKNEELKGFFSRLEENRRMRNELLLDKLQNAGLDISWEEVKSKASGMVGKPHFVKVMLEKGYVADKDQAYKEWFNIGGKAYVPKKALTPQEAIKILNKSGASTVWAHPLLKPELKPHLESLIKEMKSCGLFGLEAWHSIHSPADTNYILELGKKYDLDFSGGSDYHGPDVKPDIKLGTGNHNLAIPVSVLEKMKQKRKAAGLPV